MTDLEITALCADSIEIAVFEREDFSGRFEIRHTNGTSTIYDPLHDDSQAMELMKKHHVLVQPFSYAPNDEYWRAFADYQKYFGSGTTANRAICECVAKMQQAKP